MKRLFTVALLFILCVSSFSQSFTDSNLPIIVIDTDGGVYIPDAPRVNATMRIIYRGKGLRNYLIDRNTPGYLNYNGRINIEIRGSSSQSVEKKQYSFSTLENDNVTQKNVSILGLPADNDWILNGLAFEPSLIRDYLCYNLSRKIGEYATRTVYCEVVINGKYNGLYVLQEKIKQGVNRVNVSKIGTLDNIYPNLTGGYITKADKTTGGDPVAWTMSSSIGANDVVFIHVQPKPEEVTPQQNDYIRSQFYKLSATVGSGNSSLTDGFPSIIDIPSFIDYLIINELSANADAYQFSTFYHKERNGKLRAGPIWDQNLTFGNDLTIWGYDRSHTDTWQFANGDNEGPKFWTQLFNNSKFRCSLAKRWNQLIQPDQPLNYYSIEALVDTTAATINEAAVRENQRWKTVPDFSGQITEIKNFIKVRIPWMTTQIGSDSACRNTEIPPLVITKIMYQPDSSLKFSSNDQEFIEIRNTGTTTVNATGIYFSGTGLAYQFPDGYLISPNSSVILASNARVFTDKHGFAPSGQFTRNLSDSGMKLVLSDGFGNVIDSVNYSSKAPWPDASGNGYYLELIDPLSDNSVPSNWFASANTLVGVRETECKPDLKLYPSPVTDMLYIESYSTINTLNLINFQGKIIVSRKINNRSYQLNMSPYPEGLYIIQINTTEGNVEKKIIKK